MDWIKLINSFWVGGLICVIAQILIDKTKITPAKIMVLYVVSGCFLTLFGLYKPIVEFAGAGATVPIVGFGHLLAKGAMETVDKKGLLGALTGGITAAAGGLSAAILFGYIAALLFKSKGKK